MKVNQYRRDISCGLDLSEVNKEKASGKFIEKIVQKTAFVDPFGEEIENNFTFYKIFAFELIFIKDRTWLLMVENPPRSLKSFVNFLSAICEGRFSVDSINFPVIEFLAEPKVKRLFSGIKNNRVVISGLNLGSETVAKLDVKSTKNVLLEIQNRYHDNFYFVDKLFATLINNSFLTDIEISRNAVISASPELLIELNPICVEYFSKKYL
jgi:hypothetical protein